MAPEKVQKLRPNLPRPESELTYSIIEAGRLLGIGRTAAYSAAKSGDLPIIRLGRLLRVPKVALMERLRETARRPAPEAKREEAGR